MHRYIDFIFIFFGTAYPFAINLILINDYHDTVLGLLAIFLSSWSLISSVLYVTIQLKTIKF